VLAFSVLLSTRQPVLKSTASPKNCRGLAIPIT